MPAVKGGLPTCKRAYCPLRPCTPNIDPDFEVSDASGKVRCTICYANGGYDSWINRSSVNAHTKSERHRRSLAAGQRRVDGAAEDNTQWAKIASDAEEQLGDDFVPVDAIPSIWVTRNELTSVLSQLQAAEEEEMTRDVLSYLDDPQDDDPSNGPINGWQSSDQSLLQTKAGEIVTGNLTAGDPGGEHDEVLADLTNEART